MYSNQKINEVNENQNLESSQAKTIAENHGDLLFHKPHQQIESHDKDDSPTPKYQNIIEGYSENQMDACLHAISTFTFKALVFKYKSEHNSWRNAKHRSKKMKGFKFDSRFETFPGFLRYMGPKPNPEDTLDRIDPSMGYILENVRWASKQLQSENKCNVKQFEVLGKLLTYPQIAEYIGMKYDALMYQLKSGICINDLINKNMASNIKSKKKNWSWTPWPSLYEQEFEDRFRNQNGPGPFKPQDRCIHLLDICRDRLNALADLGMQYQGEVYPEEYAKLSLYWITLRKRARECLAYANGLERMGYKFKAFP